LKISDARAGRTGANEILEGAEEMITVVVVVVEKMNALGT
jgi:hypothetical protein